MHPCRRVGLFVLVLGAILAWAGAARAQEQSTKPAAESPKGQLGVAAPAAGVGTHSSHARAPQPPPPVSPPIGDDHLWLAPFARPGYGFVLAGPGGSHRRYWVYYPLPDDWNRYDTRNQWWRGVRTQEPRIEISIEGLPLDDSAYYYGRQNRYWPYPVVDGRDYSNYVVIQTPTAQRALPLLETLPPAPPAAAEGADTPFSSRLSPMLGGPDRVAMAFALGEARLKTGQFEEAVAAFRRAAADGPRDAVPELALALAMAGAGQYGRAAQLLREMLPLAALQDVRLDADRVFGSAEVFQKVLADLEAAAAADQGSPDVPLVRGFVLYASGRSAEAAQVLWKAYDTGGPNPDPAVQGLLLETERLLHKAQEPAPEPAEGAAGTAPAASGPPS